MGRITEPIFNQALGKVLETKHPRWNRNTLQVERTNVLKGSSSLCPDIIVYNPGGAPVIVETEFAPARTVEAEACSRLGLTFRRTGTAVEQVIALRVPPALRRGDDQAILAAKFDLCVHFGGAEEGRWPKEGWLKVDIDGLASVIELVSLSEKRVQKSMDILMNGVQKAAMLLQNAGKEAPDMLEKISKELRQEKGEQTWRMAMAIVANALTFHTAIAGNHGIETLDEIRNKSPRGILTKSNILAAWNRIYKEVNYIPIFQLASDLFRPIRNGTAQDILEQLAAVASELAELGATTQHDLNGRMLQRLIIDRQYLATYYTLPSSARLLAELAVERLDRDWSNGDEIASLRIADFACGTGALLYSAYSAILARYRRNGKDDRELHPRILASVLYGTDIMPVATHLTVSVLSSVHPSIPFQTTSIAALPYGKQPANIMGGQIALGALELIQDEVIPSLFGSGEQRMQGSQEGKLEEMDLPHRGFDLVIMNPPFTRSSGHAPNRTEDRYPMFEGLSTTKEEAQAMTDRLRTIMRRQSRDRAGHGHAGLASNFIDIAHAKLKDGGVLAIVLPAAFASGEAWKKARKLLDDNYHNIEVVSLMATGSHAYAFSADTGMGEVLVVATKGGGGGAAKSRPVHQPRAASGNHPGSCRGGWRDCQDLLRA